MKTDTLRSVSLVGLKETSRHFYEGTISADLQGNRYTLPFLFSDMNGRLQFRRTDPCLAVISRNLQPGSVVVNKIVQTMNFIESVYS